MTQGRWEWCSNCRGTGSELRDPRYPCNICGGTGKVWVDHGGTDTSFSDDQPDEGEEVNYREWQARMQEENEEAYNGEWAEDCLDEAIVEFRNSKENLEYPSSKYFRKLVFLGASDEYYNMLVRKGWKPIDTFNPGEFVNVRLLVWSKNNPHPPTNYVAGFAANV